MILTAVFFPQFTAYFLAFKSISDIAATGTANGYLTVGDFFTNAIFRNIVVSMLATLGLYIFASLLFVSSSTTYYRCGKANRHPISLSHGT